MNGLLSEEFEPQQPEASFPASLKTAPFVSDRLTPVTSEVETCLQVPISSPPLVVPCNTNDLLATKVDQVLAWPAVQVLLQCDSLNLSHWGGKKMSAEKWLIDISKEFGAHLPVSRYIDIVYSDDAILDLDTLGTITLNRRYVESICSIYFRTFHCTYPILDRSHFYSTLLPQVCSNSFSGNDSSSALVLMILALGTLAWEGAMGPRIVDETGRETGIRGGSAKNPPGLVFLNQAIARLGVALTQWNTENLMCYILCA